jgi:hypothetical protein
MAKTTARITVNKVASKAVNKVASKVDSRADNRAVNKEDSRVVSKEAKAAKEDKVALAASVVDADVDVDASAVAASPHVTSSPKHFTKIGRGVWLMARFGDGMV